MSHFLTRLVERARGTASRVEPVIAPRFASTPIVEIASEVETPRQEPIDQQPTGEEKSSPRAAVQPETMAEEAEPKILRESEKPSPPKEAEKLLVPTEIVTPRREPEKLLVPPEIVAAAEQPITVRPSKSNGRPVLKNGTMQKESFTPSRSKRSRSATPLTTAYRNLERDLMVPNESSEEPPIVRVTIGRIDVRATPTTAPSRKSSTRSEPKLTLDAYLKSRKEGTR